MTKAEESIEKLVKLAQESYQCKIEACVGYFPIGRNEYIEITAIRGSDLFVCLFCAQFPDEVDGFPVHLSEAVKNDLYDSPLIDGTEN
jgi:hypothetical protein